jgi:hypothetical protein
MNDAKVFRIEWSELETMFDAKIASLRRQRSDLETLTTADAHEANAVRAQMQQFTNEEERLTFLQRHLSREPVALDGSELLQIKSRLTPQEFSAEDYLRLIRDRRREEAHYSKQAGEAPTYNVLGSIGRDYIGGW